MWDCLPRDINACEAYAAAADADLGEALQAIVLLKIGLSLGCGLAIKCTEIFDPHNYHEAGQTAVCSCTMRLPATCLSSWEDATRPVPVVCRYVYLLMGVIIGSAVCPIAFCMVWSKCTAVGAISGAIVGLVAAVCGWLGYTKANFGVVNLTTTGAALVFRIFMCV